MSLKTIIPALLVSGLSMPGIQAVEGDNHYDTDVRLEGVMLPERHNYDQPFRVGMAVISHQRGDDDAPIGLIGGGAIYYTRLPVDDDNTSERAESLSAQVRLGLGLYVGDAMHVEVTPFLGAGGARGTINDADTDPGLCWEYGISTGAFASFGRSAQLGIIAGWIHSHYELDINSDSFEGIFIGASFGIRG